MEFWKSIKGYEGIYEISNTGKVKSLPRKKHCGHEGSKPQFTKERILSQSIDRSGYVRVKLSKNGKSNLRYLHRLIAETFVCKPNEKTEVNHKDGDKLNNYPDNLEWCTRSENVKHAFATGLKQAVSGEKNNKAKLTENEVRKIRLLFHSKKYTQTKLSEVFNVSIANINSIVNNKTWKEIS